MPRPEDEFAWLFDELDGIQAQRFHRFERRASRADLTRITGGSYARFVELFGRSRLYRTNFDGSHISIGLPEDAAKHEHATCTFLTIAHEPRGLIVLRSKDIDRRGDGEVHLRRRWPGGYADRPSPLGETFAPWLQGACSRARKRYKKQQWLDMAASPVPFTEEEQAIVEARRLFDWRVIECEEDRLRGVVRIEVVNRSKRRLPSLSIGVRSTDMAGGYRLKIGHIGPGQSAIVQIDTYDRPYSSLPPKRIREWIYESRPDPLPEDKDRYGEFWDLE